MIVNETNILSKELGGGIGIVEMLYRCNIVAIVGGGSSPMYPSNKVMLWDEQQAKCIAELTFRTDVKGLRLKSDKIIVILEEKIYVYNFSDITLIDHIETIKNPKGLKEFGEVFLSLFTRIVCIE